MYQWRGVGKRCEEVGEAVLDLRAQTEFSVRIVTWWRSEGPDSIDAILCYYLVLSCDQERYTQGL